MSCFMYGIQEIIDYVYSGSPASEKSDWNYYSKNADPAYPNWTLFKEPSSTNFELGSKNFIVLFYYHFCFQLTKHYFCLPLCNI